MKDHLRTSRVRTALALLAITAAGLLVHGYHLGTDDAAIYAPGMKRAADPSLYPFNSEFFMNHAGWSVFPQLVGGTARLTGMPIDAAIFLWYLGSMLAVLTAALFFLRACFPTASSHWTGVGTLAVLLNVPVAGTALLIADPYLTARSLSTATTLFAITAILTNRPLRAALLIAASLVIHPQMAVFGMLFAACHAVARKSGPPAEWARARAAVSMGAILPLLTLDFHPARGTYREILVSRGYFLVSTWHWWEWVGIFAPLTILALLPGLLRRPTPTLRAACRASVLLGLIATVSGVVIASSRSFQMIARIQPMRSFHPIYMILFLLLGGLLGEYVLKHRWWRHAAFFGTLAGAMLTVEVATYPMSPHVEWPGAAYGGGWPSAFLWIRSNTPKNAVFAINPDYMLRPGVDLHGFRALAERSVLADNVKDSGAVSVFPGLADDWQRQTDALKGWHGFRRRDFETLSTTWGIEWVVIGRSHPSDGLNCRFENDVVKVCRILPVRDGR
ncbi:MAG: hypothetical protein M3N54_11715 [Acidobacteriota bacterium]|nr:hypothetical protein [Acidobacteriota bacterium]